MCLEQFIERHGIDLIAIFITLAALGFSIFGAIYSNLTHNIRMADANARLGSVEENRYWRTVSAKFREQAKQRAYSTNLCFWSLFFAIVTLILYLIAAPDFTCAVLNCFCVGTFSAAVVFWVVALLIAAFYSECKELCRCLFRLCACLVKSCGCLQDLLRCLLRLVMLFRWLAKWPIKPDVEEWPLDY